MKELLKSTKDFAELVIREVRGLWQLRLFRYFVIGVLGLIFATIMYAIKVKGASLEDFGMEGVAVSTFKDFVESIFTINSRSAAAAHRDAHEIIKRFYEITGKMPFGYEI